MTDQDLGQIRVLIREGLDAAIVSISTEILVRFGDVVNQGLLGCISHHLDAAVVSIISEMQARGEADYWGSDWAVGLDALRAAAEKKKEK